MVKSLQLVLEMNDWAHCWGTEPLKTERELLNWTGSARHPAHSCIHITLCKTKAARPVGASGTGFLLECWATHSHVGKRDYFSMFLRVCSTR